MVFGEFVGLDCYVDVYFFFVYVVDVEVVGVGGGVYYGVELGV